MNKKIDTTISSKSLIKPITEIPKKRKSTIPKIVWQYFDKKITKNMPLLYDAVNNIKKNNPDWVHKIFTEEDAKNYLIKNFPKEVGITFDSIIPQAFKCDFLRYCLLYKEGGVYIDCKMNINKSLNDIIDDNVDIMMPAELSKQNGVLNGFLASYPNCPIFKEAYEKIMNNVKNNYKGDHILSFSGPLLLGDILAGKRLIFIEGYYLTKDDKILRIIGSKKNKRYNFLVKNNEEIIIWPTNYRQNYTDKDYGIMWLNDAIIY